MNRINIRLMEMVRIAVNQGGITRFDLLDRYLELARRGVLCRLQHFERSDGMMRPTSTAKAVVDKSLKRGLDLGIFKRFRPDDDSYARSVAVTRVGKLTLDHWDDPTADGIYD